MKGFRVKIILTDSFPEVSREVILPEKINFRELDKVICELFSLSDRGSSMFCLDYDWATLIHMEDYLLKRHIGEKICFNYQFECNLWFEIILNETVDYDKIHVSLISFAGKFNPPEDVHVSVFNNMMISGNSLERFDPERTRKELEKITILRNRAFEIRITCRKIREVIWRDFIVPERTTFEEIEDLILVTFDTKPVSFGHDDRMVDYFFKSRIPIYSQNREFRIDIKRTVYSDKRFIILKNYDGGQNPFDLWHEYYPKVQTDNAQSSLDDFIQ